MRLISSIKRAEKARSDAQRRGAGAPKARGFAWSRHETVIDRETLKAGESVAVDIDVSIMTAGRYNDDNGLWISPDCQWVITERVTLDPKDLGVVTMAGKELGRVAGLYGKKVVITYASGCDPSAAPRCGHCGREVTNAKEHECGRAIIA